MTISPDFSPFTALAGGILIGLSATLLLAANGRIAGVSGIVAGALCRPSRDRSWLYGFLAGLAGVGLVLAPRFSSGEGFAVPPLTIALAGLLVGFGARLGNGCTSGHGICGLARGAKRSIVASATFVATGMATVYVVNHVLGVSG